MAHVVEAEGAPVAAGGRQEREDRAVDRGSVVDLGYGDRRRFERPHRTAQTRRQDLLQLGEGPPGHLLEARDRTARGGASPT